MPVTRTTLLSGPASATFGGHTFFAQNGILVTPALELDAVDSDAQGGSIDGGNLADAFFPTALNLDGGAFA